IDYLRDKDTAVVVRVAEFVDDGVDLLTTEPVVMELLMGADKPVEAAVVEQLTNGLPVLSVEPRVDYRSAADIYQAARRNGLTVRSSVDCLIAAVAIRNDVPLLHKDADYDVIAEIAPLRTHK
ncbi:MAG: type II toxin-antitoxin system VapC family toxin, partial [Micromonosporaceae bacterium]